MEPEKWPALEACYQMEALLLQRIQKETRGQFNPKAPVSIDPTITAAVASMKETPDILKAVKNCQTIIASFTGPSVLSTVCGRLLHIADNLTPPRPELVMAAKKLSMMPSTSDRHLEGEQLRDYSPDFIVLETLYMLISRMISRWYQNRDKHNEIPMIPEPTLKFVFDQATSLVASPAIRVQATKCLKVLSSSSLDKISNYFVGQMGQVKEEDDERAFVYVQRALTELCWGLGSRYETTYAFLNDLYAFMDKRVERGVLKIEICSSLAVLMKRLLTAPVDKSTDELTHLADEYQGFEMRSNPASFWTLFEKIYNIVAKWSRKAKYAMAALSCMSSLVVLAPAEMFHRYNPDLFKAVLEGVEEAETRQQCMQIMLQFLTEAKVSVLKQEMPVFTTQINKLLAVLFDSRRREVKPEEADIYTKILVQMGVKHVHHVATEVAKSFLEPEAPRSLHSQQAVMLRALGDLARLEAEQIKSFDYSLGPLLTPYIEDQTDAVLVRAALRCFPVIKHSNPEKVLSTANRVVQLTMSSDREVSSLALKAMQEYVMTSPSRHLLPSLHTMLDVICTDRHLDLPGSMTLRLLNNILFLLGSFTALIKKDAAAVNVSPQRWMNAREHVEAMCLIYLSHPEVYVRAEVYQIFECLGSETLRAFEDQKVDVAVLNRLKAERASFHSSMTLMGSTEATPAMLASGVDGESRPVPPYLGDVLLDKAHGAVDPGEDTKPFSENLAKFLARRVPEFHGICTYAACRLQARIARFEPLADDVTIKKLRQASIAAHSTKPDPTSTEAAVPQIDLEDEAAAVRLLRNQVRALCMLLTPAMSATAVVHNRLRTSELYEEQVVEILKNGYGFRPPLAGLTLSQQSQQNWCAVWASLITRPCRDRCSANQPRQVSYASLFLDGLGPLLAPLIPFLHPHVAPSLLTAIRLPVDEQIKQKKAPAQAWRHRLAYHESTLMVIASLYGLVCHSFATLCSVIEYSPLASQWCSTLPELIAAWNLTSQSGPVEEDQRLSLDSLTLPGIFSVALLVQRGLWLQGQYQAMIQAMPRLEKDLSYELFEIVKISTIAHGSGSSEQLRDRTRERAGIFSLITLQLLPTDMQACFAVRTQPSALFPDLLSIKFDEARQEYLEPFGQSALLRLGDPRVTVPGKVDLVALQRLEIAQTSAMHALLQLGPLQDEGLELSTLSFLHYLAFRGPHTHADVQPCLALFLQHHPHRLRDYLRMSHPESHVMDDYIDHPANRGLLPVELSRHASFSALTLPVPPPSAPLYLNQSSGTATLSDDLSPSGDLLAALMDAEATQDTLDQDALQASALFALPSSSAASLVPHSAPSASIAATRPIPIAQRVPDQQRNIVAPVELTPQQQAEIQQRQFREGVMAARTAAQQGPSFSLQLAQMYWQAVVTNCGDDLDKWLDKYRCPPQVLLLHGALQAASTSQGVRILSSKLLYALLTYAGENGMMAVDLCALPSAHESRPGNAALATVAFMQSSAEKYYYWLPQLLDEQLRLLAEIRCLSQRTCEMLVRLIMPFTSRFHLLNEVAAPMSAEIGDSTIAITALEPKQGDQRQWQSDANRLRLVRLGSAAGNINHGINEGGVNSCNADCGADMGVTAGELRELTEAQQIVMLQLWYLSLAVLPRAGAASLINEMWMTLLTNAPVEHGVQAMIARHFVLFVIAQRCLPYASNRGALVRGSSVGTSEPTGLLNQPPTAATGSPIFSLLSRGLQQAMETLDTLSPPASDSLSDVLLMQIIRLLGASLVVRPLLEEIRRIADICPFSADQFLEFIMARTPLPSLGAARPRERSALELLISLCTHREVQYEVVVTHKRWPHLLNAASLLLPADSPSTQRLYHLTVELYSPELGDADQSELSCHLGVESHRVAAGLANVRQTMIGVNSPISRADIIKTLHKSAPQVLSDWAQCALVWTLHLIDVPLAIAALELYRDTVQSHQPNNLVRLVLLLYLSIQDNDSARSAVLMNILSEVPEHKVVLSPTENGLDVLTWQSLVSISFAFLSFSRTDAYRSALNLLSKMLQHRLPGRQRYLHQLVPLFQSPILAPSKTISDMIHSSTDDKSASGRLDEGLLHVLLKGGLRDSTSDDVVQVGLLLCRGLSTHFPADNQLLTWLLLLKLLRALRDPANTRCTELALLLQLYSPPLATMFARHDALVVRTDKQLPMEAVDFVSALGIQDANSMMARPQAATPDDIANAADLTRRAGQGATGVDEDDWSEEAMAKLQQARSRRASLSFGLQTVQQMQNDDLCASQSQLLHKFLAFRVSNLGVDEASKTLLDATRAKYLSAVALVKCTFQFLGSLANDASAFNHVYRVLWLLFQYGEMSWRTHLLDMFDTALTHSTHVPQKSLQPMICEQLSLAHFASEAIVPPVQLERIMQRFVSACMRGDPGIKLNFNFSRTKQSLPVFQHSSDYVFDGSADKNDAEKEECVQRLEANTFLVLARTYELISQGRQLPRGTTDESATADDVNVFAALMKNTVQPAPAAPVATGVLNVSQFSFVSAQPLKSFDPVAEEPAEFIKPEVTRAASSVPAPPPPPPPPPPMPPANEVAAQYFLDEEEEVVQTSSIALVSVEQNVESPAEPEQYSEEMQSSHPEQEWE